MTDEEKRSFYAKHRAHFCRETGIEPEDLADELICLLHDEPLREEVLRRLGRVFGFTAVPSDVAGERS